MPEESTTVDGVAALPEAASLSRSQRWFELALVLSLAVGGPLINSLFLMFQGSGMNVGEQAMRMTGGILHEIACLALLGYVLSRRGKKIHKLGLSFSIGQVLAGLGLAVASYIVYVLFGYAIFVLQKHFGIPAAEHSALQMFGHATSAMVLFSCINPFFEELIVRAFLMTEVRELTGSWTIAVTASALLQASYHLYYGWPTAAAMFFQFLVLSIFFAWTRKVTPAITAHAVFDLWGLARIW